MVCSRKPGSEGCGDESESFGSSLRASSSRRALPCAVAIVEGTALPRLAISAWRWAICCDGVISAGMADETAESSTVGKRDQRLQFTADVGCSKQRCGIRLQYEFIH